MERVGSPLEAWSVENGYRGTVFEWKKEEAMAERRGDEKRDNDGREMALVVARRGIARHRSVACISGSDGTDSIPAYQFRDVMR